MKLLLASSRDRNTLVMSGRAHLQLAPAGDTNTPPRFTINAYNGGIINPDRPFRSPDAPLIIELAGVRSVRRIAAILDHDDRAESVVGQTTRVRIGNSSIDMEGVVTGAWRREGTASETVVTHARNGFIWQVSLGGHVKEMESAYKTQSVVKTGVARLRFPLYRQFHVPIARVLRRLEGVLGGRFRA